MDGGGRPSFAALTRAARSALPVSIPLAFSGFPTPSITASCHISQASTLNGSQPLSSKKTR